MTKIIFFFNLISLSLFANSQADEKMDYSVYHQQVIEAETLIASEEFNEALQIYERLFENYDFIFLREYQIATQLALYLNETKKVENILEKGILAGWQMKSIKRNKYLDNFRETKDWKSIKKQYRNLHKEYESNLNQKLRKRVKKMFSKDQWKALGALFAFSSKAQDSYAEKRFAPQSEKHITEFSDILHDYGYPGEKIIGNDYWMSTILGHHNSISQDYNKKDKLYPNIKPKLIDAMENGQISPFEFAFIDDWYRLVKNDRKGITYGIIEPPTEADLNKTNELRKNVYLRPIEIRNKLVDVQEKTGMDFYLKGSPWIEGKIKIK